jgi:hypothetical protein
MLLSFENFSRRPAPIQAATLALSRSDQPNAARTQKSIPWSSVHDCLQIAELQGHARRACPGSPQEELQLSRAKRPLRPRQLTATRSFTHAIPVNETRAPREGPERRAPPSLNPDEHAESGASLSERVICMQYLRACTGTAQAARFDVIRTVVKDPAVTL